MEIRAHKNIIKSFGYIIILICVLTIKACKPQETSTIEVMPTLTLAVTNTQTIITNIPTESSTPIMEPSPNPTSTQTKTPVVFSENGTMTSLQTNITNIDAFLEQCPTNDPLYEKFKTDFIIRIDGIIVEKIACSEPISEMPIEEYTNELIAYQVFRTAYYMDPGIPNYLPWTEKSLYDWLASSIGGVNLKTAPIGLYCCDDIDGKLYISYSLQDDTQRDFKRNWLGISGTLDFYAHEARHANAGGYKHTSGCPAFKDQVNALGCDHSYDLNDLGAYGIQYWLNYSWLTGFLNVGMSCNPETAEGYVDWILMSVEGFRERFVTNAPEVVDKPDPPYGGPCYEN